MPQSEFNKYSKSNDNELWVCPSCILKQSNKLNQNTNVSNWINGVQNNNGSNVRGGTSIDDTNSDNNNRINNDYNSDSNENTDGGDSSHTDSHQQNQHSNIHSRSQHRNLQQHLHNRQNHNNNNNKKNSHNTHIYIHRNINLLHQNHHSPAYYNYKGNYKHSSRVLFYFISFYFILFNIGISKKQYVKKIKIEI